MDNFRATVEWVSTTVVTCEEDFTRYNTSQIYVGPRNLPLHNVVTPTPEVLSVLDTVSLGTVGVVN